MRAAQHSGDTRDLADEVAGEVHADAGQIDHRRSNSAIILDELIEDPENVAEVERLLSGKTRAIRLSEKLERGFRRRTWRQSSKLIRSWMIWIAFLDAFAVLLNAVLLPARLVVPMLAPAVVIFCVSLLCAFVWRKQHSNLLLGSTLLTATLIILACVSAMGLAGGYDMLERFLHAMLAVAVTAVIIFPIPLSQSVTIAVAAVSFYLGFQLYFAQITLNSLLSGSFFFASGLSATAMARQTANVLAHQTFLFELRDRRRLAQLARVNHRLEHLSKVDVLTGVANRRWMREEFRSLRERGDPVSVFMCDIDDFKSFNDTAGHFEGDRCLVEVARLIADTAEAAGGFAARYGGEEFAVLLPDADEERAAAVAERIRHRVEDAALPHPGSSLSSIVTISIGIAVSPRQEPDFSPEQLVDHADKALYEAKRTGRNRVCRWGGSHREEASGPDRGARRLRAAGAG